MKNKNPVNMPKIIAKELFQSFTRLMFAFYLMSMILKTLRMVDSFHEKEEAERRRRKNIGSKNIGSFVKSEAFKELGTVSSSEKK